MIVIKLYQNENIFISLWVVLILSWRSTPLYHSSIIQILAVLARNLSTTSTHNLHSHLTVCGLCCNHVMFCCTCKSGNNARVQWPFRLVLMWFREMLCMCTLPQWRIWATCLSLPMNSQSWSSVWFPCVDVLPFLRCACALSCVWKLQKQS